MTVQADLPSIGAERQLSGTLLPDMERRPTAALAEVLKLSIRQVSEWCRRSNGRCREKVTGRLWPGPVCRLSQTLSAGTAEGLCKPPLALRYPTLYCTKRINSKAPLKPGFQPQITAPLIMNTPTSVTTASSGWSWASGEIEPTRASSKPRPIVSGRKPCACRAASVRSK